eukprot:TRINITY_DN38412_c0_g1_i1.p1 TRINITY_DN38412_c0_g1~~TRINITY_DN38412_c0_g1_i1.p1  ORF type:complete len:168 (-),score=9.88 TRINITY_DN38412_c0_g1_i1:56-559(-)
MIGKFTSSTCAAKASVSLETWSMNCAVPSSICPPVACCRWASANLHVCTARSRSGQSVLTPASHAFSDGKFAAVRATRASGKEGGAQALVPESQVSATPCSRPPSDFLRKHFLPPSCSPKDQKRHSGIAPQALAQTAGPAALNLSLSRQSSRQQPFAPKAERSTKMA